MVQRDYLRQLLGHGVAAQGQVGPLADRTHLLRFYALSENRPQILVKVGAVVEGRRLLCRQSLNDQDDDRRKDAGPRPAPAYFVTMTSVCSIS